jgi:hypothetical protein
MLFWKIGDVDFSLLLCNCIIVFAFPCKSRGQSTRKGASVLAALEFTASRSQRLEGNFERKK